MRKTLTLSILFFALFLISSCVSRETSICLEHKDLNGDLVCDACATALPRQCQSHFDNDEDGLCDFCKASVPTQSPHYPECGDNSGDELFDGTGNKELGQNEPCTKCGDKAFEGLCDGRDNSQSDCEITAVTINGKNIKDFVITSDSENLPLASFIQSFLYEKSGLWLEIVDFSEMGEKNYISVSSAKKSGGEGFYITKASDNLIITSEFPNKSVSAGESYLAGLFDGKEGSIELTEITLNVRDVFYKDFGAVGDGVTDSYEAIKKTHDYANENGHTVVAEEGAAYYIGPIPETVTIKTNVDFKDATFIIDDREIASLDDAKSVSIFTVSPSLVGKSFDSDSPEIIAINEAGGLTADTDKIELGLGFPALLMIKNSNHKDYIRYGSHENFGEDQSEVVLVDEYGNLSSDTPILFSCSEIISIRAIRADEEPITVKGGSFITRANQAESDFKYYERNIVIARSNTTIDGVTYKITDEREGRREGDPYHAFLKISNANNLLIKNCFLTAHKTYYFASSDGYEVEMNSETINTSDSNSVTLKNCRQLNFFDATGTSPLKGYSKVMSSSRSKNLICEDSALSCFDAGKGVYNARIINSSIADLRITGNGNLTVEGSHIYNNLLISLCEDYGSTRHGNVTVRNVTLHNTKLPVALMYSLWYNHDFGYQTCMPETIIIDNFNMTLGDEINLFVAPFDEMANEILQDDVDGKPNVNKMIAPKRVIIRNNKAGIKFILPKSYFFKDTEFIFEN